MATHSSILAWRTPWMEEPGGLQSMGCKESDTTERLHFISVVSSIVQKVLSLIRSHLFIFAFISITLGGGS